MKKVIVGLLALTLVSTAANADGGKKKSKVKSKIECTKGCPDSKDCHKNAVCPDKPGCVCK
jgi:hypothetical protein